ncbi:MAG TPA: ribosome maturation factor RimM [Rhizomicrobium sp.]
MADDILLGVVIGAQGLRGEVRVKIFTETPERLAVYGALHTAEGRSLDVVQVRNARAGTAVVQFKGIEDRDGAESLAHAKLFVARAALPETARDEFYHTDLVGLRAQDGDGRVIGEVSAIYNYGAGDVIELSRGDGSTVLLPFTRETVPEIDLEGEFLVVAEPADDEATKQRGVE